ncbi:carbohydrate binding domain-containing protein [Paenibacillus sp. FSL K6-3182]|uniref:carbohydrate binding domain-containing protein n=1 Tax=Paenibacillus sp. FSL K6-3182 TaxID=2921495 RepID=UPI0030CB7991
MNKRFISIILVFMMLTSSLPAVSAATATDEKGTAHWGEKVLEKWISKGMLSGYPDGSLQPDRQVTRAEFTKLVHAIFQFEAKGSNTFTDVAADAWYSKQVAAALEAGVITGYPDGSFKPDAPLTRQEAAKITAELFKQAAVDGNQLASFTDYKQVQAYAKVPLEQLLAGGYITGYPDQTIRPKKPITRAEAITLLDRIAGEIINAAGSYENLKIAGNAVVNTAGVKINKTVIDKDLFLTQGIGEGDVFLTDVDVKGTVYINGGGINSIHFINSKLNKLIVNKPAGKVRVVLTGSSQVQQLIVETGSDVQIDAGASSQLLTISDTAEGTAIQVKGTLNQIVNTGSSTTLNGNSLGKSSDVTVQNGIVKTGQPTGSGQSGGGGQTTPQPTPTAAPTNSPTPSPTTEPTATPTTAPVDEWELVWNDEFDGSGDNVDTNGVNLDKWAYQLGTGSQYGLDGWGNNEEQYYRSENIKVADGKLTITADDDGFGGKKYTSGRLYTEPTFNKTYGKFEARMKLPVGNGIWPAFWMMPKDSEYGVWASSGELDIMEARGRLPEKVGGAIHYGKNWPANKSKSADYIFGEETDITDYHTYGVEWEPGEIRWYVDGQLFQKLNNWDSWGADQPAKHAFPAPFDKPFYMILNLAVGGNFDGGITPDPSLLPVKMEVDYVRVYELTGRPYKTPVEPSVDSEPYPDQYKEPIAGNFIHDNSYSKPFTTIAEANQALDTNYWNFVHVSTFQGNGSISVEALNGVNYAKADITSSGNAIHAVQLIQNVTLGKGRWYKLTFDAKSNANRNATVKFGGGETRGWTTYSDIMDVKLTNNIQSYEMIFQMGAETDTLARLEFNLGLSTNPVWIGNVKVEETASPDPFHDNDPKEPLNGNHVYNGSFDLGRIDRLTYWNFNKAGGNAAASVNADTRELKISNLDGETEPKSISLTQSGINLLKENDYKVTFKARAASARSIQIGVYKSDGTAYAAPETISLASEMKEYTFQFAMEQSNDVNGQLVFLLGGHQADIYLDDIKMIRLTNNNTGELALADQFPVKNGDFSSGKVSWSEHVQGRYDGWGSSADFNAQNEELKIAIASEGVNPWDVMLMQNNINLFKGKTYTVTLDASSSKNREMEIVIEVGSTRYLSKKVQLTQTKQAFSYELLVQSDITPTFKLLLGKLDGAAVIGEHDVFVDNIHVEQQDARSKAFLVQNGYFDAGMQDWSTHIQGIYDGPSRAAITDDNGAVKVAIANAGLNAWDIVLQQGSLALVKGKTYVVTFLARATSPRTIEAVVENSAYNRFLNEKVQLDTVTKKYSYEFTMAKDDNATFKLLFGVQPDAPSAAHDVFIDNVHLELKGAKEAAGEKARSSNDIMLLLPPVISKDVSDNELGQNIDITFNDNEAWRNAITDVFVDELKLPKEAYQLASGKLTIDKTQFSAVKSYTITIRSTGYELAQVIQSIQEKNIWSLVWNDEFDSVGDNLDTNGVDLDKWAYQLGNGSEYGVGDWGNNELQFYKKENIKIENGQMIIEAKKENFGGKQYTSGRLWTSPTFSKAYGKFEARIKLPAGQGLWPAFWMMPKDSEYGGWASSGEIDIMEARGRVPGEVDGTIHFGKNAPNNKITGAQYEFPQGEDITGYHTYSLEWEPGELRWYVDGNLFQTLNDWNSWGADQPEKYAFPAPFDKEFYIILNLAVGGNYDGGLKPDPSLLSAQMEIDYVRAYELTGRPYKVPVEPMLVKDSFPQNGKTAIDGNFIYDPAYTHGIKNITVENPVIDINYWNFLHGAEFGGAGEVSVDQIDGSPFAKVDISNGGNVPYSLQLVQYVTLVKGQAYKISFDAKASAPRSMSLKFGGDANSGWGIYSDNFEASLKDQVGHYEYRFLMTDKTNAAARLEFNLGQNVNDVWIGNVHLEEIDELIEPSAAKAPLNNGNHIYNGGFDLGTMDRLLYWNTKITDSAIADISVDPLLRRLNVNISDGGTNASSIKLTQQGINLLQKDSYELTFDAEASAARTITVQLKSKDGSTIYSGPHAIQLDTSNSSHKLSFTMPPNVTDEEAQLEFLLGGSNAGVQLDNIKLIRTTNLNVDFTGVELFPLKNGDFSNGLSGWEPFTQGGTAAFMESNGAAKIAVTNVGGEAWNVMFNQSNLKLSKGMTYVLSFDASSTVARDIEAALENAGYTRRFYTGPLMLTPSMQHFEFTFKMMTDDNVALKFLLGKTPKSAAAPHDIFFDNVVLEVKDAPMLRPPTLIPDKTDNLVGNAVEIRFVENEAWRTAISAIEVNGAVLAGAKYTLQPGSIVIDQSVFASDQLYTINVKSTGFADTSVNQLMLAADGNLVLNGGMTNGSANWVHWFGDGGDSKYTPKDGVAQIDIYYHGGMHPEWNVPVGWSTQFNQSGIKLEAGKSYELSFNAWSTVNRPIAVELGGYNNTESVHFNLTGDSAAVYKKSLRPNSNVDMTLKFLLGNVVNGAFVTPDGEHTIYIDNVAIREVAAPPVLVADSTENKVGQTIELTFADSPAWRAAITQLTIDGAAVQSSSYTVEAGKIKLNADLFTSVKTYLITVAAAGYGISEVQQQVKTAAANIALHKAAAASSGNQPAANAVDGAGSTRWESESTDPQWLSIDLGAVYKLESAVLSWEGAYGKAYKLQVSSAAAPGESDWTDVFTEAAGNGGLDNITLNGQEARHIRMVGSARGTNYGYSLWEFEVYGTWVSGGEGGGNGGNPDPGTTPNPVLVNLALNKQAVASSFNAVFPAHLLTDGDKGTRWEAKWSDNNTAPYHAEWFYIDLEKVHSINKIILTWEAAYGKAIDIQVAAAGSDLSEGSTDWKTVHSLNRELKAEDFVETITLASSAEARYIRILVTEKGLPPYGPSLFEIEVYE